ncbi:MAG: nucleotidyltransferase family protein, partial [Candidatus Latescibacterota bacterium]
MCLPQWRRAYARTAATTVALQELARVLRALTQQGLDVALLSGAALLRFYPYVGCRPMDDVDLLCPP